MNQQALSASVWSVAGLLRGDYRQSEYGRVILPFTVLRRLDCILEATKPAVLAENEARLNPGPFLLRAARQHFFNTSPMDMKNLIGDADRSRENLFGYVQAFSPAGRRARCRRRRRHPDRQGEVRHRLRCTPRPHPGTDAEMRSEKALIALLRGLVQRIADESERNYAFAERLDSLLSALPEPRRPKPAKRPARDTGTTLPDVHAAWTARGETDFRLWLRDQPIATIRALTRAQDLDPARRTSSWKGAERLADFVAEGLRAPLARGSAFISTTGTERPEE